MSMTRHELLKLEGTVVNEMDFENIHESDFVMNFQNCGRSGLKKNCIWIILTLIDGTDVNLYIEEK